MMFHIVFICFAILQRKTTTKKTNPHLIKYLTLQSNSTFWDVSNEYGTIVVKHAFLFKMCSKNIHEINYMNEVWWSGRNWTLRFKIKKKFEIIHIDENWWCKWILHVNESISMKSITLTTYMA